MSQPDASFNPYAAPVPSYMPGKPGVPGSGRSGWYTFYCVIAIVLGGLGLTGALMGGVSLIANQYLKQAAMQQPMGPGVPQEMAKLNQEMQREVYAVESRYFYYLMTAQILLVFVAGLLLTGGIMALSMKRFGARLLANAFLVASVFDVARLVLTVIYQMEVGQVMRKYLGEIFEKAGQQGGKEPPPEFTGMMSTFMGAMLGVGICFTVGWVIIKLVIYLSGWVYLNKPETQALLKD
jgi:hypothetical protein